MVVTMAKRNKIINSAIFVALLQSASAAVAKLNVMGESMMESPVGAFVVPKKRDSLIEKAIKVADAAYNSEDLIKKKMTPLTHQVGLKARDELAKDHSVATFSATIPKYGIVPAGIVTYKEDAAGKAEIMIGFHGSESAEDFTGANLLLHPRYAKVLGIEGRVHGGFFDRYMQSRAAMMNVILEQLANHGKSIKDVDILVAGHSLGGALATLAAADIKKNIAEDARVDLITFASPRVVSAKGAKSIENLLGSGRAIRIWREADPVPASVLGSLGFKHVGRSVKLKSISTALLDLANHSRDVFKSDIFRPEEVEILEHEGYRSQAQ